MARRRVEGDRAAQGSMMVDSKVVLGLVSAQDAVGLMRRRRQKGERPQAVIITSLFL